MQKIDNMVFYFDETKFANETVSKLMEEYKNKIKFSPGKEPYVTYKLWENKGLTNKQLKKSDAVMIKRIKEFLKYASHNQ